VAVKLTVDVDPKTGKDVAPAETRGRDWWEGPEETLRGWKMERRAMGKNNWKEKHCYWTWPTLMYSRGKQNNIWTLIYTTAIS